MYVLLRYFSPYTQNDIYLGVYRDIDEVEEARRTYIEHIEMHGDPYEEQAHMTVDLEQDVNIESFPDIVCDLDDSSTEAFLLVSHAEHDGQLYNQVMFIADQYHKLVEITSILTIEEQFNSMWCYVRLPIGILHYTNTLLEVKGL